MITLLQNKRIILGLVGAMVAGGISMADDIKPSNSIGNIIGNQGIVTQGQIGNNTINVAPARLTFQPAVADDLIRKLPAGKPVVIHSVGSDQNQQIATQYHQYLLKHGIQVKSRVGFGVKAPPPDYPITIDDRGDTVFLTIDASVIR